MEAETSSTVRQQQQPALAVAEAEAADHAAESSSQQQSCSCCGCAKHTAARKVAVSLLLGQLLSLLICGTAVTSGFLQQQGVSVPTGQSFLNYLLLGATFGSVAIYRLARSQQLGAALREVGWKYLLAAIIDVEANYLIVHAYQYTSVTSVQLLDCLTIPTVLVGSYWLLGVRFSVLHYAGVTLCMIGVAGMLLADWLSGQYAHLPGAASPLLGDAMVIGGAILYGISNVWQELLVRRYEKLLYIGLTGLFASFISGAQVLLLERQQLAAVQFSWSIGVCFIGFALCMFLLYSLMPVAMTMGSAVLTNLSLLTADLYALFIGLFVFSNTFHPLYFIAYTGIMLGVIIYTFRSPRQQHHVLQQLNNRRIFTKRLLQQQQQQHQQQQSLQPQLIICRRTDDVGVAGDDAAATADADAASDQSGLKSMAKVDS